MGARPTPAWATPEGAPPIDTKREDALIVWDEAHHLEHFVRSAVFDSSVKSFGFLVPTPSRPTLAEADDAVFAALGALTEAREHVTRWELEPWELLVSPTLRSKHGPIEAGAVAVLETTRVAGLDATVLAADDAGALGAWLKAHDFVLGHSEERWLAWYVERKWVVTAFVYARPDLAANAAFRAPVASRAVRMSFAAEAPVYPYREPEGTRAVPDRHLRLFVLGDARVDGDLADLAPAKWSALVPFAAQVSLPPAVAADLPGVELPGRAWLHEMDDRAETRPLSDLVFRHAPGSAEVRRPPIVDEARVPIPIDLFLVGGAVWGIRRWRRARRA
jgi:hypothetical protein